MASQQQRHWNQEHSAAQRRRRAASAPADVQAYARALTCSDCGAHGEPGEQDSQGQWHITVAHAPSCPRLRSGAPDRDAMERAAAALTGVAQPPDSFTVFDPRGKR
jgi:hypothetical protein